MKRLFLIIFNFIFFSICGLSQQNQWSKIEKLANADKYYDGNNFEQAFTYYEEFLSENEA